MIYYRPHRGMLYDAMSHMKVFNTIDEMLEYIARDLSEYLTIKDLSISHDFGKDCRINWKETRHVCTKRFGTETHESPMCIGMCSIEGESNG